VLIATLLDLGDSLGCVGRRIYAARLKFSSKLSPLMGITPGQSIGPYRVVAPLGAGGMGEVYRARDTKLDRDVAVKILPDAVASDADRLMRFEREAKTLAALNHPHIAQVYGIEDRAIVMELVEGDTLADCIARGAVPIDDALPIARQIADALEAAHEAGIIHRDLKPANIKVRPDGRVKVLDFGLAKPAALGARGASGAPGAGAAAAPGVTVTSPAVTMQGAILGTAAYMAPEQARGNPLDSRADLWAFGCVLFELLSGARVFAGDTVTDTLASIVKDEPRWDTLPADTPAAIRRLLRRCLQKDRRKRLASAADAGLEIDEAIDPARSEPAARAPQPSSPSPLKLALGLGAIVIAVGGAYFAGSRTAVAPSLPAPVARFVITAPPGTQIVNGHRELAISQDGQQIAFIARGAADQHIYVRRLDDLNARQIAGTEGARDLAFSPDSRWLAFHAGTKIRKVSLDGGAPTMLADAVHSHGLVWHPTEDAIYFAPHQLSAVWKVAASGGVPAVQVTTLDAARGERSHEWPIIADDGRTLIFSINANGADIDEETVSILTLATNARHTVQTGGTAFALLNREDLLYMRMGSLMGAQYRDGRLGSPALLEPASANARVALSPTGTLAFVPEPDYKKRSLVWITPDGVMTDAAFGRRAFASLALSPDGQRVAIRIVDDRDNTLYTAAAAGGALTPLANPGAWIPAWSPDGRWIAGTVQQTRVGSNVTISRIAAEAGRTWEVLVDGLVEEQVTQWTPDGRALLFSNRDPATGRRSIKRLAVDRTPPEATTVVESVGDHMAQSASLSPDGRWLAYESNETGRLEVYVQGYPTATARIQVSREGGSWPQWSNRGDTLYFRAGAALLMSALTTTPELASTAPRVIVHDPLLPASISGAKPFDVAADGRVLAIREDDSIRSDHIVVVQNWLSAHQRHR
jgi:serine/threonine protein kinase/Tol biopolymer transport system component